MTDKQEMAALVERLRATPNWQRQEFGDWKSATNVYDRAPSEAGAERQHDGDPIVGHKTFRDGDGYRHEPLRQSEADSIMLSIEQSKRRRTEMMPNEQMAIRLFFDAWLRLQDFNWKNAIYCPKDGTEFEVIEAGSTGKHRCVYEGEWPKGSWWIVEDGDMCPSRPVLYRDLIAAHPAKGDASS